MQPLASKTMKNKGCEQEMTKHDHVREKVEETLASLDRMEQLEAGPAFFSRLQERLAAGEGEPAPSRLLRLPGVFVSILRPVFLAILILVNLLTVVFVAKTSNSRGKVKKASVMILAVDYSLNQNPDELHFTGEEVEK